LLAPYSKLFSSGFTRFVYNVACVQHENRHMPHTILFVLPCANYIFGFGLLKEFPDRKRKVWNILLLSNPNKTIRDFNFCTNCFESFIQTACTVACFVAIKHAKQTTVMIRGRKSSVSFTRLERIHKRSCNQFQSLKIHSLTFTNAVTCLSVSHIVLSYSFRAQAIQIIENRTNKQ